jgi:hypothetical protein
LSIPSNQLKHTNKHAFGLPVIDDRAQAFQLSSKNPGGIESEAKQQKQAIKLHIRRT